MGFGIMEFTVQVHVGEGRVSVGSVDADGNPDGLALVVESYPCEMYDEDEWRADWARVTPPGLERYEGFVPMSVVGIHCDQDKWQLGDLYVASAGSLILMEFGGVVVARYGPKDMYYTLQDGWAPQFWEIRRE